MPEGHRHEKEIHELWNECSYEVAILMDQYPDSFRPPGMAYKQKEVISCSLIFKHKNVFKQTRFYFLIFQAKDSID